MPNHSNSYYYQERAPDIRCKGLNNNGGGGKRPARIRRGQHSLLGEKCFFFQGILDPFYLQHFKTAPRYKKLLPAFSLYSSTPKDIKTSLLDTLTKTPLLVTCPDNEGDFNL